MQNCENLTGFSKHFNSLLHEKIYVLKVRSIIIIVGKNINLDQIFKAFTFTWKYYLCCELKNLRLMNFFSLILGYYLSLRSKLKTKRMRQVSLEDLTVICLNQRLPSWVKKLYQRTSSLVCTRRCVKIIQARRYLNFSTCEK